MIGDPALKLAYPQLRIETTEAPDSIRPLQKVTFKGFVTDINGQKLDDINGLLQPTVFDKVRNIETLNNEGVGVFRFDLQNNIIFRGNASIKNGEWEFSFVAPKDIAILPGEGRVSYYSMNQEIDGTGFSNNFKVGGPIQEGVQDSDPPEIDLFMNDANFVSGGLTDEAPTFIAEFFDENGINTVGNGIGHDIVAILDDDTQNPIVLNDFYEAAIDSFQRGTVRYPMSNLSPGTHKLTLTAWDVFNNPSTSELEFVVAENENIRIENVLNYPNPFTTATEFHLDHNQPGQLLDVRIQVFTISGKLVKTIDHEEIPTGFKISPIGWDGRDDFGDRIGRGVYVYHIRVRNIFGEVAEKFEKLVLL